MSLDLMPVVYPVFVYRESGTEVDSYPLTLESYLKFLKDWKDGIIERSVAVNLDAFPPGLKPNPERIEELLPSLPLILGEYLQSYGLAYQFLETTVIPAGKVPIVRREREGPLYPKPQDYFFAIRLTSQVITEAAKELSRCDNDHFLRLLNSCSDNDAVLAKYVTETLIDSLQKQLWRYAHPCSSFLMTPATLFELATSCHYHTPFKFPTYVPNGLMTCGSLLGNPIYVVEPKCLGYSFGCSIHPDTMVALSTQRMNGTKFERDGGIIKPRGLSRKNDDRYWHAELELIAHVNAKAVSKGFLKGSLPEPTVYVGTEF